MLLRRLEYGQCKLEARLNSDEHTTSEPACCIFCPETLCIKSGFDSWLDTLPIIDSASCFLDMELLQLFQELLVILIVEPGSLQPVSLSLFSYCLSFVVEPYLMKRILLD